MDIYIYFTIATEAFPSCIYIYIYCYRLTSVNIPESFLGPKTAPRGSASVSASVRRGWRKIVFSCILCSSCCADASA